MLQQIEKYDFGISLAFNLSPSNGHIDIQQYATGEQIRKKKLAVTNETWGAATLVACTPDAFYRYQFENNISIIVQSSFNPDIEQHQHSFSIIQHAKPKLTTEPISLTQIKKVILYMAEEAMQHNIVNIDLQYQFIIGYDRKILEQKLTNKLSSIIKDDKFYNANCELFFQENDLDSISVMIMSGFLESIEQKQQKNGSNFVTHSNIVGLLLKTSLKRNLEKLTTDKKIQQKNDFIENIDDMLDKLKNKSEIIYNSILVE
jgi:hypothetical protein